MVVDECLCKLINRKYDALSPYDVISRHARRIQENLSNYKERVYSLPKIQKPGRLTISVIQSSTERINAYDYEDHFIDHLEKPGLKDS